MRPEGTFIPERLAAQHCADLLRAPRQAVNPLAELALFGERLAELLGGRLGQLCPGAKAIVQAGEPAELQPNAANDRRAEPVVSSVIAAGPKEAMMISSLPQAMVLSLVDIALGGTGRDCAMSSPKLPMSGQLMFNRFEKILGDVLAEALELSDEDAIKFRNQAVGSSASQPFAGCKRTVLPIRIALAEAEPCELVFTFPGATIAALFANRSKAGNAAGSTSAATAQAIPTAEPFAGIPLPLRAILVDMAVPVSMLARLKPGMTIPVTVARSVPLLAGDQTIAHGTVGAVDDCNALQLTRLTSIKEN